MKMNAMILLAAISTAALPGPTLGATWNALKDFSLSQSPTSTWQYGYGTAGSTFTQLAYTDLRVGGGHTTESWDTPFQNPWDIPLIDREVSGSAFVRGTGIVTPDALGVHPGETSDVIIQWTAPSAGIYSFSGLFQLQDAYPTGVIGEVYANATPLFAGTLTGPGADLATATPGQSELFSGSRALSAGDKLTFAVNDKGDYGFDYTGFNVTISNGVPELPQWAMLIVGFGLTGATMRRRRKIDYKPV
jgi:hypothetical protein